MIDKAIFTFIGLLNANWESVSELGEASKQEGLLADWAQACWEAIVEASIPFESKPARLVVYGDGADCHPNSSRFSCPSDLPTCQIRCRPTDDMVIDRLTGKPISRAANGYALDRFVSFGEGWFLERPPFDHALIENDGNEYVVALDRLAWELAEIR